MPSESPVAKRKSSAPRKETLECQGFDGDLDMLFYDYYSHPQNTPDAPTNRLLSRFDAVGKAGFKAFQDIADFSQRLVHIDVALTSHRGMLLDSLASLHSEYDSLLDAVLRALAAFAHYLLKCREPHRPPGRSCPDLMDTETAVDKWKEALTEMASRVKDIQDCWKNAVDDLRAKLASSPLCRCYPGYDGWILTISKPTSTICPKTLKTCTNLSFAFAETRSSASAQELQTVDTTLVELIRLNGRAKDLNTSLLSDLFWEEDQFLREHSLAKDHMMRLHYRFNAGESLLWVGRHPVWKRLQGEEELAFAKLEKHQFSEFLGSLWESATMYRCNLCLGSEKAWMLSELAEHVENSKLPMSRTSWR
ncbi:hypothetical protein FB45DRAFT_1050315 [Roridomyces roridus]|uniref:Uncharacterized protein n=1 Tax=Roridomyces roridus TaxID=1738132 RepID=A0AAD7CJ06_9AGAR|nr:hypothetical protein FB45DRAFT_1050315 [Roridomyces roridus]